MTKFSNPTIVATGSALILAGALALAAPPALAQNVMDGPQRPAAGAAQDPLADVNFGPPQHLRTVTIPGEPGRFCHWLQKSNAEVELRGEIANASWNAMQWDHLAYDLKQLRRKYEAEVQRSKAAADAAWRAGDFEASWRHFAQSDRDGAIVRRLSEAIRAAEAQIAAADALEAQLRQLLGDILARPVDDCGQPGTGSINFYPGTRYDFNGYGPRLRLLTIPVDIPSKVCSAEQKAEIVRQAEDARDAAAENREQWRMRAAQLDQAIRAGHPEAETMQKAYKEAQEQILYWEEDLQKARQAQEKANAIEVIDCSEKAMRPAGSVGAVGSALASARAANPAGSYVADGAWGVPGEAGNLVHTGSFGPRPFDGSEAERALRERMKAAEASRTAPAARPAPRPVLPSHPGHRHVDPHPTEEAPTVLGEPDPVVAELQESVAPTPETEAVQESTPIETIEAPVIAVAPAPTPAAPTYPDCPTHPGMAGTPEHIKEFHGG